MQCVVPFVLHPVSCTQPWHTPHSQYVMKLSPALQHRGLGAGPVLSSQHLGLCHGHTGESRGQTSATPVSWGFAGQPRAGGLQDLRLGAARWPLPRWFMGQILQRGATGLLLAVGMVGQGLPFMFRVCTSSWTIKLPLSVIHLLACYCQWAAQSWHHVQ